MKSVCLKLLLIACIAFTSCSQTSKQEKSVSKKVDAILSQMTLAEKVGQMTQVDMRLLDSPQDIQTYHIVLFLVEGVQLQKQIHQKDG